MFFYLLLAFGYHPITIAQTTARSQEDSKKTFHADRIVLKLKTPGTSDGRVSSSHEAQLEKIRGIVDYVDHYQVFSQKSISNARSSSSGLQNIYKIKLKPGSNIWHEINRLQQLDIIEYAEPIFQSEFLFTPNDPQANPTNGQQDYLSVIKAYEGWQIDQSDSSIVIGIVDSGVNMNHEDLGNIAFNYADPINGVDDDGDGYLDNFYGWDLADNDNNPTADGIPHGSLVTGMSSATTNNGIGMAGTGFKSRYLPVKIFATNPQSFTDGFEGIVYAADHGCSIINLSWKSGSNSKYGQDIINYAVLEKDVVVVAAAGNTHQELDVYPASFDNVLSVGASDINDNLASWATYSHFIDIMAPGDNVYTTKNDGGYGTDTGTSLSAPLVAGAAALVRSHFPEFSAIQVMEQLRVSSDDIYTVGSNMNYFGQLGSGRLNIQNALSDILTPSIRLSDFQYEGNFGTLIFPGDTVRLNMKLTNYLRNAENVTVTLSNPSKNVSLEMDQFYISSLGEFESYENTDHPISFIINSDVPPGARILFRIDFSGNNYKDFQYFEINTTPGYFDMSDGNLTTSVSSDGDIGSGVLFKEEQIDSQAGLIISLDTNHVMDNVINDYQKKSRDKDFIQETGIRLYDNSISDFDARSVFKPKDTIHSKLNIKIEQKILTWDNNTDDGYMIFEYRIINTGDSALNGLNVGMFADWDLLDYYSNEAAWDAVNHLGYVFDKTSNALYAGIALLTNQTVAKYSIDLGSLNGNVPDIDTLFGDKIKHDFLTSNTPKTQAGTQGSGNDVAHIVGGKNINLGTNQSVKVTFAMLGSSSLDGLKSALSLAKSNYTNYSNDPPLVGTFYSCIGDSALIDPEGEIYEFYSDVDALQKLDSGYSYKTEPVLTHQVYYTVNLDSGYAGDVMKVNVQPGNPTSGFILPTDTLLIESGKSASISFENTSILSDQWKWDFGNGYTTIVENPSTDYDSEGLYSINLIASNEYGCSDTTNQNLFVGQRIEKANVHDQQICKGTMATISATNTIKIKVYREKELLEVLYEGDEFITDEINSDTTFFIVNANGAFESVATEMQIIIKHPEMGFNYQIDTLNLNEKYVLNIYNSQGQEGSIRWLVNDNFQSDQLDFNYVYTEIPFDISQIKVGQDGCTDTLRMRVSPVITNPPLLEDIEICKYSDLQIHPINGETFYFYDDISLSNLLHKGRSLFIEDISAPMQIFVTSVVGLLESNPATINVTLNAVKSVIESSTDTIDLAIESQISFSNLSVNSLNSHWLLPSGIIEFDSIIFETYDKPGEYLYTLVSEGYDACLDTAYCTIQVISITGLAPDEFEALSIYPNPSSQIITIDFGYVISRDHQFEMLDISGKTVSSFLVKQGKSHHLFDIAGFKSGIYFIKSMSGSNPIIAKILKR